jgi:hypothetical protein
VSWLEPHCSVRGDRRSERERAAGPPVDKAENGLVSGGPYIHASHCSIAGNSRHPPILYCTSKCRQYTLIRTSLPMLCQSLLLNMQICLPLCVKRSIDLFVGSILIPLFSTPLAMSNHRLQRNIVIKTPLFLALGVLSWCNPFQFSRITLKGARHTEVGDEKPSLSQTSITPWHGALFSFLWQTCQLQSHVPWTRTWI